MGKPKPFDVSKATREERAKYFGDGAVESLRRARKIAAQSPGGVLPLTDPLLRKGRR